MSLIYPDCDALWCCRHSTWVCPPPRCCSTTSRPTTRNHYRLELEVNRIDNSNAESSIITHLPKTPSLHCHHSNFLTYWLGTTYAAASPARVVYHGNSDDAVDLTEGNLRAVGGDSRQLTRTSSFGCKLHSGPSDSQCTICVRELERTQHDTYIGLYGFHMLCHGRVLWDHGIHNVERVRGYYIAGDLRWAQVF